MPKSPIKQLLILTSLLMAGGLPSPAPAQGESQAVMLQYHHIDTSTPPVTSISPADFRIHMEYLRDHGFTVLPLEQVVDALRDGTVLPDRSAVITFDDGYLSVYEDAWPVLRELDFPFTVFISAGLVSSNSSLYASWAQLREMGEHGATLANHSVSHPYLLQRRQGESEAQWLEGVEREIVEAERIILEETGQSHKLFAYPYGEYDPVIQELVRALGYTGIGQHSGPINAWSDFTALPRFPLSGIYASMNTFGIKMNSLAFKLRLASPDSPITGEVSPSAVLDFEGDYRFSALSCFNNNEPMRIQAVDEDEKLYRIETDERNTSRRFRYNCTLPGENGRYYWYSVPWINPAIAE